MLKKLVFIHLLNDYSGSPKVLSQIVKDNTASNNDVLLYTSKDIGFLSKITKNHFHFYYKRFDNKIMTLFSYLLSQLDLFFKILKYKKDDIVYINTLLPFGAAIAAKIKGCKVIYHIHETSIKPALLKKFLRYIVSFTASKIIFVSNDLAKKESFENISTSVIHNALEKNFMSNASTYPYHHLHDDKFVVMMICSLKDYKGIPEFIKIAKSLENGTDIKFRLILNAEQKEIDDYFKNDVFKNIEIFSKQTNLESFYSSSSLVLNLSRIDQWIETFGLTIVESLAFGVPVIVPPVGGPIEIIDENNEGYIISSYDIEKVSSTISTLSINKKLCLELSSNARTKAMNFNEDIFLEKIKKVIYE